MKFIILTFFLFSCSDFQSSLKFSLSPENLDEVSSEDFLKALEEITLQDSSKITRLDFDLTQTEPLLINGKLVHCKISSTTQKNIKTENQKVINHYIISKRILSGGACSQATLAKNSEFKKEFSFIDYKNFSVNYFSSLLKKVRNVKVFKTKDKQRFVLQFLDKDSEILAKENFEQVTDAKQIIVSLDQETLPSLLVSVKSGSKSSYNLNSSTPKTIFSQFHQSIGLRKIIKLKSFPDSKNILNKKVNYSDLSKNFKKSNFSEIF